MYEHLKQGLEGCVYTVFTPFDEQENIDYESLERYLNHLYFGGARKFYVMAYNSRYSQLKHSEIMELNEFCIKLLKRLDPENIVVVGDPIHCSTKESTEFAVHAKETGADLISLIVREKYFNDEQILDHFAEVGRNSNMPILVHEMPFLSGYDGTQMHWPHSLFRKLPSIPEIVALKEDAKDFETTCLALELEPRIRVVIAGRKSTLMQYKPFGAMSYLNGISMLDARIGEAFWQAWKNNDQNTIDFILNQLEAPFFDQCASKYGWHRTNKALLQAAGYMHRRDRMPLKHLNDTEYQEVVTVHNQVAKSIQDFFS
ncbi:dihydrodipicolinate synthase family protein [uncultured Methylophaga sp.]|uniref:dihydrodipicolinate synthase family protein n=1 Tax=uncultured Methylophaga sp. TaxID=285271 RepID=UPI00261186DF|nr:dihydrodipicolinate synthase family protein [uncultured Methylophaga sp.]